MIRCFSRIALVAFTWGALSTQSPRTASAQATAAQKAAAEALFDEGVRLLHAGSFESACTKLETSQQLDPGVGTLLYLGECYERLGRSASAWANFREAASLAEASNQPDRMKLARERAARLEGELSWLRIEVAPEIRAIPGLEIRRANVVVPVELSGNATPIDPGDVLVEASAPGYAPFSTTVRILPKGHAIVTIPWLRELPASTAAPPLTASTNAGSAGEPARRADATSQRSPTLSALPWVLDGVGVVGLGVGTYYGIRALSKASDARDKCPGGLCLSEGGKKDRDSANRAAIVADVALGVGAAALVTGIILHLVLPSNTEGEPAVGLTPILDGSQVGLSLSGRLGS